MFSGFVLAAVAALAAVAEASPSPKPKHQPVNETTCNGQTYRYEGLAGYGFVPPDGVDKFGDNLGGLGSSVALEAGSWRKKGNRYEGILWTLPDRGWNTEGTLNYQPRVHKFKIEFSPKQTRGNSGKAAKPNLQFTYLDTVRFTGPDGEPVTGLDPDATGALEIDGFPDLPVATYIGDGFGRDGPGGKRISVDTEGLVLNSDGSFWISDEYGPYIYKFDKGGRMVEAIRPPDAFIPQRNGSQSFSAASPPRYDPDRVVEPEDPETGRNNNQGFEGLSASPDGKTLSVLIQSALMQEGGREDSDRRHARLLQYDITSSPAEYIAEYVVPLPTYDDGDEVAAQSSILQVSDTQYLVLARDSNAGSGQDETLSVYRQADVFDIADATDVKGDEYDSTEGAIASETGELKEGITPATYCSFLDFNVNSELAKFGLYNGGEQGPGLLNEKWEALALAPVCGNGEDGEFYLISLSDNDFITQNGFLAEGTFSYADESGFDLNNQALVFKVKLPPGLYRFQ